MADEMMTKIQEAIRAQLPAQLGAELQKVLAEGEAAKKALAERDERLTKLDKTVQRLEETVKACGNLAEREATVKKREEEVLKRELKAELNEFKVAAAEQRTKDCKDVVALVFANNRYKYERTTHDSENIPMPPGHTTAYASRSTMEKIEAEGTPPGKAE